MQYRQLGRSNLKVSSLCLGGNVFGWTADEKTSFHILDTFFEMGGNFLDTADIYSRWASGIGGESETIIGRWLKNSGKRKDVVLATKVGMEMGPEQKGLSRKYIFQEVETSLKRLQTDYIDLYQAHKDDPSTPLEETLDAFATLVQRGKVRVFGASNYAGDRLLDALRISEKSEASIGRYECLQPRYNLYDRDKYEKELEPICKKYGLGVIPYYSLAAGFLTGKYRDRDDLLKSPRGAWVGETYLNNRGRQILGALDQISEDLHTLPASVALAWVMSRPSITAPIASATSLDQLQALLEATQLVLKPEHAMLLDQASG